jgi:hypothetical protein
MLLELKSIQMPQKSSRHNKHLWFPDASVLLSGSWEEHCSALRFKTHFLLQIQRSCHQKPPLLYIDSACTPAEKRAVCALCISRAVSVAFVSKINPKSFVSLSLQSSRRVNKMRKTSAKPAPWHVRIILMIEGSSVIM